MIPPLALLFLLSPQVDLHRAWWAEVDSCLVYYSDTNPRRQRDFDKVEIRIIPQVYDGRSRYDGGHEVPSRWIPDAHLILVGSDHATVEHIIKHEMIHEIWQGGTHRRTDTRAIYWECSRDPKARSVGWEPQYSQGKEGD